MKILKDQSNVYNCIDPALHSLPQVEVLHNIVSDFEHNKAVEAVVSRGSIAKACADQLSDIDVVLVIKDDSFTSIVEDPIIRRLPFFQIQTPHAWIDTNVPNFGGVGFVDLVSYQGMILQLDTYMLPSSQLGHIHALPEKVFLYERVAAPPSQEYFDTNRLIDQLLQATGESYQLVIDVLLHFFMLNKYIIRKDAFLSYKYWYLLRSKVLNLMRTYVDRDTRGYNYYDIKRQLDFDSIVELQLFEKHLERFDYLYSHEALCELFDIYKKFLDLYVSDNASQFNGLNTVVENHMRETFEKYDTLFTKKDSK